MSLYATAGTKLFIGSVLATKMTDFVVGDFSSITWIEITSVESMGSLGDQSEISTFASIGDARMQTFKGVRSAGTMEVVCGVEATDAGQLAVIAAEKTNYNYAFKLELNDKPATGASPKGGQRLFVGTVISAREVFDQANSVRKMNFGVGVNSNVVRVAASAT